MRRAIAVVFMLVGLAAVIWGLAIAFGDLYDIGRGGLLLISLIFIVPRAVLLVSGLLLIRSRAKPRER
jgi:hypothetical protein